MNAGEVVTPQAPLRVLLLTSIPYGPYDPAVTPDDRPDRYAVTRALARLGIEMRTIDPHGFPLNPLAGRHPLFQSLDPWRTLQALWLSGRYDVVISGNDGPAILLVPLARLLRRKTPILVWDLSPAERWRLRAWLQDLTLPKVDGVLALPAVQEAYVRQRWGSHPRTIVVGHHIDTAFYHPQTARPGNYVLAVGDDPGRDYQTLLRAVSRLDLDLRIKTAQPLVPDESSSARVGMIRDHLSPVDFRALYAACDFVVVPLLPHTRNASGVSSFLEAGAMGKAAIVTDSDGIRDYIKPNDTCLVVPPGDPEALAAAIARLRNEPDTCRRLGENARRVVEQFYAPAAFAERLAAALRHFVPASSTATADASR